MKNKKKSYVIIGILVAVVAVLSIAYATLSTTLSINFGTVTQPKQAWNIHFKSETVAPSINTGTDRDSGNGNESGFRECGNITSAGTTITLPAIKLSKPGDKCVWKLTVENSGTIAGNLNAITATHPTDSGVTCNGSTNKVTCGNIIYMLNTNTNCSSSNLFTTGGTISADGGTQTFYLCAAFNQTSSSLPTANIVQTGLKFSLAYIQQ